MDCVPTTVRFVLKLLRRRVFDISLKHKPIPPNCASSIFETNVFLPCYTDVIFFYFHFKEITFALYDVCSQSFDSTK